MSAPNTQEVTTNAGEQAVRTDEAAGAEDRLGYDAANDGNRYSVRSESMGELDPGGTGSGGASSGVPGSVELQQ